MNILDSRPDAIRQHATNIKAQMYDIVSGHPDFEVAIGEVKKMLRNAGVDETATLIIGQPGAGKTALCKKLVAWINAQNASLPAPSKMPVIHIESSITASAGGIAYQILEHIGDPKPQGIRGLEKLIGRVANYFNVLGVKLLIIDEAHNYAPTSRSGKTDRASVFLKMLMNETKVPILFTGLNDAKELYASNSEIGDRMEYRTELRPIPYGLDNSQKAVFAGLVEKYASCLNQTGTSLTFVEDINGRKQVTNTDLLDAIYLAHSGSLRRLRKLFMRLVDAVMDEGIVGDIPPELIERCWEKSMNPALTFNPFEKANKKKVASFIKRIGERS